MSKRSKNGQAAAREQKRDWDWMRERDDDQKREELPERDDRGADEYRTLAKEFRG